MIAGLIFYATAAVLTVVGVLAFAAGAYGFFCDNGPFDERGKAVAACACAWFFCWVMAGFTAVVAQWAWG